MKGKEKEKEKKRKKKENMYGYRVWSTQSIKIYVNIRKRAKNMAVMRQCRE
jgi:hypothetical protein